MKVLTPYSLLILSLSVIYILFGLPKIFGASSVENLILASLPFLTKQMIALLGLAEVVLGLLILIKKFRKLALVFMLLHLAGTFFSTFLNFNYFYNLNTIFTLEGEFVFKNLVLMAVALYILNKEGSFKQSFLNKPNGFEQNKNS